MNYVIPYITNSPPWWVGIDVYNHNADPVQIAIQFQRENGTAILNRTETVSSFAHYRTGDIPQDTVTIHISGSNSLLVTAFQGMVDSLGHPTGISYLPVHQETNLKN